jgi:glycosyltransferase involved in cell wall biosynthesis
LILSRARAADVVVAQRVILEQTTIEGLERIGSRVVFDFDDSIFLTEPDGFKRMLGAAWKVLAGSDSGFEAARRHHDQVVYLPSVVDVDRFRHAREVKTRASETVTVGWIGGPSTVEYLEVVAAPVRALHEEGLRLRLLLAGTGYSDVVPDFGRAQIEAIPRYDAADIPALTSMIDIGIMPLPDTEWARGKCAMKFLIYGAAKKPCVASRVGQITRIAREDDEVLLAATEEEWRSRLHDLLRSSERRKTLGTAAHNLVKRDFSLDVGFEILKREVVEALRREDGSTARRVE